MTFKNEGNENLIISKVQPGCGCTAAKPEKDTLAPSESTTMDITFNFGSSTGVTSKNIRIETNDPERSTVNYKIKATIVRDIICKPTNTLNFRNTTVGQEATQTIQMKNNSAKTIKFTDVRVEPEIIQLSIPNEFSIEPGKEISIVGKVTPQTAATSTAKISITTDHPDYPTYEISVVIKANASPILNDSKQQPTINN